MRARRGDSGSDDEHGSRSAAPAPAAAAWPCMHAAGSEIRAVQRVMSCRVRQSRCAQARRYVRATRRGDSNGAAESLEVLQRSRLAQHAARSAQRRVLYAMQRGGFGSAQRVRGRNTLHDTPPRQWSLRRARVVQAARRQAPDVISDAGPLSSRHSSLASSTPAGFAELCQHQRLSPRPAYLRLTSPGAANCARSVTSRHMPSGWTLARAVTLCSGPGA